MFDIVAAGFEFVAGTILYGCFQVAGNLPFPFCYGLFKPVKACH